LIGFMPPDSGFMPAFAAGLEDLADAFALGADFFVGFLEGTRVFRGVGVTGWSAGARGSRPLPGRPGIVRGR
jgi:hypothetical protein